MQLFLHIMPFSENLLVKLRNSKALGKNMKGKNMVGLIKTYEQYSYRFNFGYFLAFL